MDYGEFIRRKFATAPVAGFRRDCSGFGLFPFQQDIVEWALSKGRAAIFADTGLGKTFMQLVWAHCVAEKTGRPVLVLTPLAVAEQTVREAGKFSIPGVGMWSGEPGRIDVINYESLKKVDTDAYEGVVLDESSILKNADGRTRNILVSTFADTAYRLACTATPSPNDHTELGNHSEFLGVMPEAIKRARWFINDLGATINPWRLKQHAVKDFWRWVSTWARCVGKPSDMGDGYSDDGYDLPPLHLHKHVVTVDITEGRGDGMLFRIPEMSATGVHGEKRRTLGDRVALLESVVRAEPSEPWVIWCETNYEQEAVVSALSDMAPIDVRGNMKPREKARGLLRFTDEGGVIVTKPSIAGMGLNWQHAARMAFVGGTYSYERFYQAVRREWRFGQEREVHAHTIMAHTEQAMWHAINRKAGEHEKMKTEMYQASKRAAVAAARNTAYRPTHTARVPAWLHTLEM